MVKIWAMFMIDLKTSYRYKINLYTWIFQLSTLVFPMIPIIASEMVLPAVDGDSTTINYPVLLLISVFYWGFVEELWSSVFTMRRLMKEGTLEYNISLPLKGPHLIFGWTMKGMLSTLVYSIPLAVVVIIFFIINLSIFEILTILFILLLSMIASYGFSLIFVGIGLYVIEGDQLISLFANIAPFICGLFLPVVHIPVLFRVIGLIFPFTWGLDLIRGICFNTELILDFGKEIILLIILTLALLFIGSYLYTAFLKRARIKGFHKM